MRKYSHITILPYLKYEGVDTLDYVILTHLDEDHINGIRELLETTDSLGGVTIKQMMFPKIANPDEKYKELWQLAEQKGIQPGTIGTGDVILGEEWEVRCIYPEKGMYVTDKNDVSTTLQLTFEQFFFSFIPQISCQQHRELLKRQL